jgi:hypothetical protein
VKGFARHSGRIFLGLSGRHLGNDTQRQCELFHFGTQSFRFVTERGFVGSVAWPVLAECASWI